VFCAISSQKVYGSFFFAEETVTGMTYLDMLQLWLMPQLQNIPTFIFQQDGSPARFHCEVRQYINTGLPGRWMGRASGNDQPLLLWPPEVPWYYALWFFFLWGICQRPGIRPTIATWPRWPKGTDHCSSEEYRYTHVDACVARTWISYRCVPCHPWCTHRTSLVVKKRPFLLRYVLSSSLGPVRF
jgi:hypothetical protein